MWEGVQSRILSPGLLFPTHPHGILKGGAYGSEKKGEEEKEKVA
jgi:hypothetical protein